MHKLPETIFRSLLKEGRSCYIPALLLVPLFTKVPGKEFPAAVAEEVAIVPDTNTFFAAVGYLEEEDYIDPSPDATLVGATVFRITEKAMAWLETPPP
jgi:hypothetical protein